MNEWEHPHVKCRHPTHGDGSPSISVPWREATPSPFRRGAWRCLTALLAAVVSFACAGSHGATSDGTAESRLPRLVTREVASAVEKGLNYLAKIQQPDGSFPAKWDARSYPACMTSLSGLALLASGSTPEEGPYAENLKRAMIYLLNTGDSHADGLLAGQEESRSTYGHGFSMMFLAQCYGMEQTTAYEERIKHTLGRAISLVAHGQSSKGGWLYSPSGGGSEGSTTACVLQGLRACRNVGIKVPTETIDRAVGYLKYCQNPDGGLFYSDAFRGGSLPAISTAAIVCFYSCGVYDQVAGGRSEESVFVDKLWRYVDHNTRNISDRKSFNVYMNFYLSQAKYQRGGTHWESYYKQITKDLLASQSANGTWPGEDVGPTYGTAVACLILQLPYGYLPICER